MTLLLRLSTRTFGAALTVNFAMTPIEGHTAYPHSKPGLRPVNTHGPDDDPDWSASFDDMDGGDWEEHFALFEPDDDRHDREDEQEALELDRQVDLHYDREFLDQAYAANLDLIVTTTTLGDLAEHDCRIIAQCHNCNHRELLNPHSLLDKLPFWAKISDIGARLRCRRCGARTAAAGFNPDGLNV